MSGPLWTIYTAPVDLVTPELVGEFLNLQRRDRLFIESTTLELKRERHGDNVLRAIAGMANAAGGIVILGVDENGPSLEESPGVPPDEVTAVLSQCQSGLNPAVLPEIIPVAIPDKPRVVLVIRVEPNPSLQPVVRNGQVFIRQMGQTMPATHEQIVDLVQRRAQPLPAVSAMSVPTMFTPRNGERGSQAVGNLVVRCASAVYGRRTTSTTVRLGSVERSQFAAAIDASALARLVQDALPSGSRKKRSRLALTDDERTSRLYRAHADVHVGETTHRLSVEVRCTGVQVAFALDFQARLGGVDPASSPAPHFEREELIVAVMCAAETAAASVVPVLIGWVGGAPASVDDVYCWVESPRASSLTHAMGLGHVRRLESDVSAAWGPSQWAFQIDAADAAKDVTAVIADQMVSHYLDLAIDDEAKVLNCDLRGAIAKRQRLLRSQARRRLGAAEAAPTS